jgi:hypothetical protein
MPDVYSGLTEILQAQSWQSEIALLPQTMKNFRALDLRCRPGGIFFEAGTTLIQISRDIRWIIS